MNFEFIPLLHRSNRFWLAMAAMALTATALVAYFWRKRYLERSVR
jgi:Mg2+ and Co2+ transporter CorA